MPQHAEPAMPQHIEPVEIHLPRRVAADLRLALEREWIVTNGLGGFAFGTIAGALTRRYHSLLIAALQPPLGRMLMATKLDETVAANGRQFPLFTNLWKTGVEEPAGCRLLRRFDLHDGIPTWEFDVAGRILRKRIWMEQGANVTYVQYELAEQSAPLELHCRLLANFRDYHSLTPWDERRFQVEAVGDALRVHVGGDNPPLRVRCITAGEGNAEWAGDGNWYREFHLPIEQSVGYDHLDAHYCAGTCKLRLAGGETATFALVADAPLPTMSGAQGSNNAANPAAFLEKESIEAALQRRLNFADALLGQSESTLAEGEPAPTPAVQQLVLAADQFVVARPTAADPDGHTLIAGYPWFTDWGRDTMISLPGLTLATGRHDVARQILRTWARHVDQGMIPNRFPDAGDTPEYNTVDATLWYLWAIDEYRRATDDRETLAELYPVMKDIVAWHVRGTRFNIRVAEDGLVYAGEPGVQLTWMDAKVDGRVITPRIGKPIEISALWYDALRNLQEFATLLGEPAQAAEFGALADRTQYSFARFWNAERGYCIDVLDGPDGDDPRLQANQVFAVSLRHSPLPRGQQGAVVDALRRRLLTPAGLRTLEPGEPRYHPRYEGRLVERDEAYHQGTAWGWLLGPFAIAHFRVYEDAAAARAMLEPILEQLWMHGVGTIAEIFDAEAPHAPRGCVAQAWSVAETLRAWCFIK